MTCDAISPLEYGNPGSRSEITMWGVLVPFSVTFVPRFGRSHRSARARGAFPAPVERQVDQFAERGVEIGWPLDDDRPVIHEHDLRPTSQGQLTRHVDGSR